jgi:CRP/FNR family transcriptional regulator, cyclic AMP receptor protein
LTVFGKTDLSIKPCATTPAALRYSPQSAASRWNKALGSGVSGENEPGTVVQFDARQGGTKMPLNPDIAVLQRRIATMPLTTYQPGETVLAAGTKTGRLLILKKGAVTIRKNGSVIADVTEPGAVFGELSALLNQPHTADVRTLETSEFRIAHADLLVEDPVVLLYVAAILAQRLNLANETIIELKSELGRQRALSS